MLDIDYVKDTLKLWEYGDVHAAWMRVYETTGASWIKENIEYLGIQPRQKIELLSTSDRLKLINQTLDAKLKELPATNDLDLKSSKVLLEQSLESLPLDDPAVSWFKELGNKLLNKDIESAPLSIAILGEFSSGKSRLINALLNEKVLSVGLVPVTRSVTKIRYGVEKSVKLILSDGKTKKIPFDDLGKYIDERKSDDSQQEIIEVCIELPHQLLKNIELWDTPGFNSNHELHDQVAHQMMHESDVVIWVMASHQIGSKSESKFIDNAHALNGKLIALINQVDRIENLAEIAEQAKSAQAHYGKYLTYIIPVSAKWIEENDKRGNKALLLKKIAEIGSSSREIKSHTINKNINILNRKIGIYQKLRAAELRSVSELIDEVHHRVSQIKSEWNEIFHHMQTVQRYDLIIEQHRFAFKSIYFELTDWFDHIISGRLNVFEQEMLPTFIFSIIQTHHLIGDNLNRDQIPWVKDIRNIIGLVNNLEKRLPYLDMKLCHKTFILDMTELNSSDFVINLYEVSRLSQRLQDLINSTLKKVNSLIRDLELNATDIDRQELKLNQDYEALTELTTLNGVEKNIYIPSFFSLIKKIHKQTIEYISLCKKLSKHENDSKIQLDKLKKDMSKLSRINIKTAYSNQFQSLYEYSTLTIIFISTSVLVHTIFLGTLLEAFFINILYSIAYFFISSHLTYIKYNNEITSKKVKLYSKYSSLYSSVDNKKKYHHDRLHDLSRSIHSDSRMCQNSFLDLTRFVVSSEKSFRYQVYHQQYLYTYQFKFFEKIIIFYETLQYKTEKLEIYKDYCHKLSIYSPTKPLPDKNNFFEVLNTKKQKYLAENECTDLTFKVIINKKNKVSLKVVPL
jgi:GTPase Era involved in 16S rRNA processing